VNHLCSGDETLKPRASVQCGSNSSDEENEASLDVSSQSDCEDEISTDGDDGDGDIDTHTVPRMRPETIAAQVCALY